MLTLDDIQSQLDHVRDVIKTMEGWLRDEKDPNERYAISCDISEARQSEGRLVELRNSLNAHSDATV